MQLLIVLNETSQEVNIKFMNRLEWLTWRQQGLGSSDYSVVMNVSPWKKLSELYIDKTGPIKDTPPNYQQEKGIRMEPRIRALYELETGKEFSPGLFVMEEFPFMRVSIDGYNENDIIEIKLSNKKDWEKNIVPEKYFPQIQGQLLASGKKRCYYVAYLFEKEDPKILERKKLKVLEVMPDKKYQKELLEKCHFFWHENILKRIPPGNKLLLPNGKTP